MAEQLDMYNTRQYAYQAMYQNRLEPTRDSPFSVLVSRPDTMS